MVPRTRFAKAGGKSCSGLPQSRVDEDLGSSIQLSSHCFYFSKGT